MQGHVIVGYLLDRNGLEIAAYEDGIERHVGP